jgi:hypothetical protein
MTAPITNTISTFVESQLPGFVRDNDPNFTQFLKSYYEWLENSNNSAVVAQSKALLSYKDIDETTDQFIQYYINDFLPFFPNETALDERKLIKAARSFYQKKGSVESVQFLFRVLYNKEADIYFPKNQILKCSDGKWYLPQALNILLDAQNVNFDVNLLVGRQGLGSQSNASCIIESAVKTVDQGLGIELVQLYISNLNQNFSDLENINVIYGYDSNNNPLVFTSKIIASISNIVINPNFRGLRYKGLIQQPDGTIIYQGDPVVISGGLEMGDPSAQKAIAYVNSTTSGSVSGVNVAFGGYGYRVVPNTEVTVINGPHDTTGNGANIIVQIIDTANAVYLNVNTDSIDFEQNVYINAASYNFVNNASANANTPMNSAFSFANLQFAPIVAMNVINGGGGYTEVPSLNLAVTYYTDLLTDLVNADSSPNTIQQNMQFIDDLGFFCNVVINSGGSGYSNVTDVIVVPSSIGYNANFSFTTAPGSNAISSVTIVSRGEGYIELPLQLQVVNSVNVQNASAGVGALLTGYGFGQGANISLAVNQIGEIVDFRLTSRGFDYIASPNISLRVADLVLTPFSNLDIFSVDTQVYQGSNTLSATWIANIDSYNITSNVLRVYDYQGTLNAFANITTATVPSFNVMVNTANLSNVIFYGNGLAEANAVFLDGLIQFPGFWLTTDGFLSSDQYIQDANTYHNYSYVIVVEKALIEFKKTLMQLVHPIGMSMLGQYAVIKNQHDYITPAGNVNIIPVVSGSITSNAYLSNGAVVGVGTAFGSFGNVGDMIIFNTSDTTRWLQAKTIKSVINADYITLESNTMFEFYEGNVTFGANTIGAINVLGNIGVGDIVQVNVNNVIYTCNANSVTQNTVSTNVTFAANGSNLVIRVYPIVSGASYSIVEAAT